MNRNIIKYRITPRVLLADTPQTITLECFDKPWRFRDEIEYTIKITSIHNWDYITDDNAHFSNRNCTETFKCRSKNGIITINYTFSGEGEWKINVIPEKLPDSDIEHHKKYHWEFRLPVLAEGMDFCVYSLKQDLYDKKEFKGDLHVHSWGSDGWESPEFMASQYRRFGFDFMALTDHYKMQPSLDLINSFRDIPTFFKIFPGEEVHALDIHHIHMVNLNGTSSVNEKIENDQENTLAEIEEIARTVNLPRRADRLEKAWYIWVYQEIKKAGGIAIFPHPYWEFGGSQVVRENTAEMLFEEKLFDVFEVIGGNDSRGNRVQISLYTKKLSEGYKYPVVASSDSHSALQNHISQFNDSWTIAFSEQADSIPQNILNGYSVAVENCAIGEKNVVGDYRLVKYTWFLIEHYFEQHDYFCMAAGQAILDYIQGDKNNFSLISALEERLEKYRLEFFGK